ncbi:MAG: sugar kinase [Pseudomonadota bacterium]
MRIGCMGEVMLELVPGKGDAATLGVAGDTFNTAVYLSRALGAGAVDYLTVLGADGFSARIRARMAQHGVGTDRVLTHPSKLPGLHAIETDPSGERHFTYWRSASAARVLFEESFTPDLSKLTHLYYSGITLAILSASARERLFDRVEDFRALGGVVAFDSNYRPSLWENAATARAATERAWRLCDVALPSLDDELALFADPDEDAVIQRLRALGVSSGALKRAARGPRSLDGEPCGPFAPAEVIDSTAAGDSFNAGFLAALWTGQGQGAALHAAHGLASRVVGHRGAILPA